jgi:chromosome partitioning protein
MARIVAISNQKGGVGKTTTGVNLATALALAGHTVLLVDADPQANLTSGVGLKGRVPTEDTLYRALTDPIVTSLRPFVTSTAIPGLSLVPSDRNLTGAELELVALANREQRLRVLIAPVRPDFEFIFIDTPPSLGLLTLNALVAADAVLIPIHCEYFALEGLADLVATLRRVRSMLNPALEIEGVLLTMFDDRTNLGQQVSRDIREFFQDKVFRTVIPRNVRLGEAPSHGLPGVLYEPRSRGAEAYVTLAHELLERADGLQATPSG